MNFEDSEAAWQRIENETKAKKLGTKKKWDNPLQEKYAELTERYGREYGSNDGSRDCVMLLDDMRAFERVFRIMNWKKQ